MHKKLDKILFYSVSKECFADYVDVDTVVMSMLFDRNLKSPDAESAVQIPNRAKTKSPAERKPLFSLEFPTFAFPRFQARCDSNWRQLSSRKFRPVSWSLVPNESSEAFSSVYNGLVERSA
jgi:hypothetical protein